MGRLKLFITRTNKQTILTILAVIAAAIFSTALYIRNSKTGIPSTDELNSYLEKQDLTVGSTDETDFQQVYYLLGNKKVLVTDNASNHTFASTKGKYIVWTETPYQQNSSLVFLYDVLTRTKLQLTYFGYAQRPIIDGKRVVWENRDQDEPAIYYFDGTSVQQISNNKYPSIRPAIHGSKIAYAQQISTDEWRVMLYDTNTKQEQIVSTGDGNNAWPSFDGDKLVTNHVTY